MYSLRKPASKVGHLMSSFHRESPGIESGSLEGTDDAIFCRLELPQEVRILTTNAPPSVGDGQRYHVKGLPCFLVDCHEVESTVSRNQCQNSAGKSTQDPDPIPNLGPDLDLEPSSTSVPTIVHGGHKKGTHAWTWKEQKKLKQAGRGKIQTRVPGAKKHEDTLREQPRHRTHNGVWLSTSHEPQGTHEQLFRLRILQPRRHTAKRLMPQSGLLVGAPEAP